MPDVFDECREAVAETTLDNNPPTVVTAKDHVPEEELENWKLLLLRAILFGCEIIYMYNEPFGIPSFVEDELLNLIRKYTDSN